ncbi:Glutamate 5-kinase [Coemansia sp. RSA 2526]|nr:Glutamate 5-kinase [Coemansia sp. RSA 2526]
MSNRGRRSNKRGDRRGHLAFSNEPETFDIHSSSSSPLPESDAKPKDESTHTPSQGTSTSPDEGLTIAKSTPFKLNPTHFKKHTKPLQNMQPAAASGMNTPEQRASPSYQASHLSQEVGTSSQLDLGAPRPGHGRTPSAGTPNLRRNVSSTLITNVDKHGGPRRRRSKTNLRSKSRSQSLSRPASPTESISSELSSIGGGKSLTIVLKLGTSSICDPITHMPMLANLSLMVETICKLKEMGHRVVLVSSGAVGIGLRRLDMPVKPKELAVIQVRIVKWSVFQFRTQYLNACNTFEALLEMSVVPIVNENDTVSLGEIRFGDNDTLSAITAGMVHADYLFLLTDVDCLYTDNPRTNPMAKQVTHVTDIKALRDAVDVSSAGSAVGTGGMATKLIAAELATAAGVTTVITRGSTPQKVIDIIEHFSNPDLPADAAVPASALCTRFVAKSRPMIDRKWWILHGMYCSGTVYVDAGAVVALARFKKSLFAAGVKRVEGVFSSNQAVRVVYEPETNGEPVDVIEIGHGLVNYTSAEISRIRGCHSSEFEAILGYCDSDNVINRGNMVITIPDQVLDDVFVTRTHKTKIRAEQRVPVPASSSNLSAI